MTTVSTESSAAPGPGTPTPTPTASQRALLAGLAAAVEGSAGRGHGTTVCRVALECARVPLRSLSACRARGWVRTRPNVGRNCYVEITPAGRAALARSRAAGGGA